MMVAARLSVPMYPEATTLVSFAAVLIGALAGSRQGFLIACLYVVAVIIGFAAFLADGRLTFQNLFELKTGGFLLGLTLAAAVAGHLAPKGQGTAGRVFLAMLAGHAVHMVAGTLWLMRFDSWHHALMAGVVAYLVPDLVKSAAATGVALVLRRFA